MNQTLSTQLFQRFGQPLILCIDPTQDYGRSWFANLACSDFGICLVSNADSIDALDETTRGRLSVVLLSGKLDLESCKFWFGYLAKHRSLSPLPIVLQSNEMLDEQSDILVELGARNILSMQLSMGNIRLVLADALADYARLKFLDSELKNRTSAVGSIHAGEFRIRLRQEASRLATMLSLTCDNPSALAVGLTELLVNAIEHGIYGVGSELKDQLLEEGKFVDEMERRANDPAFAGREVTLTFSRNGKQRLFNIKDPGEGFDHESVIENFDPTSMRKCGRGVVMARQCFKSVVYKGAGNEVEAVYYCESES